MKLLPKYLLDADTFIRAFRQHYRFSICPAYWDALLLQHEKGRVASIVPVKQELLRGKDDLAAWVRKRTPEVFFKHIEDVAVVRQYGSISNWVNSKSNLEIAVKAGFASGADGWLVAFAKANGYAVCTYEVSAPDSKTSIKIPDIAKAFEVPCVSPYDMLDELRVRMVLSKRLATK